mgnify:CR=1 FL=1
MSNKNYQIPRPAQQENNVFDDARTGRKKAYKYQGRNIFVERMASDMEKAINKADADRNFPGTNIKPTPKQKLRRILREKHGTKT